MNGNDFNGFLPFEGFPAASVVPWFIRFLG